MKLTSEEHAQNKYAKIVWYDTVTWWYHLTNCNEKEIDEEI